MRVRASWIASFAALLLLASCSKHYATAPVVETYPAPVANSPANAVRRFAWALTHRDVVVYRSVFSDDFVFAFAPNDSAGNPWRGTPWTLAPEISSAGHLFVGGGTLEPASAITLTIDNTLAAVRDTPAVADTVRYRKIRTHVDLKITVVDSNGLTSLTPIVGNALFFVVRGDSAAIAGHGAGETPDSTHWYIRRWEDETIATGGPAKHPDPARNYTWGHFKTRYLP